MKSETVTMIIKGIAFVCGAICLQLGSSLGQWANEDSWPSRINWILIVVLAAGAGFNSLVSFMSGSYSVWHKERKVGNGKTTNTVEEKK